MRNELVIRALKTLERSGRLTAEDVLKAARDTDSPLHPYFDWDDTAAAAKWRLNQARELIRSVEVEVTHEHTTITAPIYLRDPGKMEAEAGYVSYGQLKGKAALAALTIELDRIEALLARAKHVAIALGLQDRVEEITTRVRALRRASKAA